MSRTKEEKAEYSRKYRLDPVNKAKEKARLALRHKMEGRDIHAKRRVLLYGVTPEQYQERYDEQDGLCAICRNFEEVLAVDHVHETGVFRGLLCKPCNLFIGIAREDIERLHSAIDYLECHAIDERMKQFAGTS